MMRWISFILVFFLFFQGHAFAQLPSITPVHGWLLGPSTLAAGEEKSACILFNQFSDGSGLRFNIRDERVETITIIYRTDVFDPTVSNIYKTMLQTSTTFRQILDGHAYSSNTLTITPPDAKEFYGELKRNSRLTIAVPNNQKTFNLRSLAQNLEKTKMCAVEAPKVQTSLDTTKEIRIYADLSLPARRNINPDMIWRAERGEYISDVLKRWSEQGGRDVTWKAPHNPVLKQDFIYEGSQENALQQLFELLGYSS